MIKSWAICLVKEGNWVIENVLLKDIIWTTHYQRLIERLGLILGINSCKFKVVFKNLSSVLATLCKYINQLTHS